VLRQRRPELEFEITASDLHPEMVSRGQRGAYHRDEVNYWGTPHHFVQRTFDAVGGIYVVKPEIRKLVKFEQANLLDGKIVKQFARSDLVFMQNVLCHLDEEDATRAFNNAVQLLKPRSGLFIDGMNLDLRSALTAEAGLGPLDYKCQEIHNFSRTHIGNRWWNYYYGTEPYAAWHPSRLRRYSTIFMRENDGKQLRRADLRHDGHEMIAEVLATYLAGATGVVVSADDDLLGGALSDEVDIVNLVSFVENAFDVVIDPDEMRSSNFQSLNEVAALIRNGAGRTH
jgi:acyl carrier protein